MILAIDPGATTGFSEDTKAYQIKFGDERDPHLAFYHHLSITNPKKIIYEPFHWRQGQTNVVLTGVEYIGIIKLWRDITEREIIEVNPSDGKGFWKDEKIRSLGLWVPGYPHGMDALRLYLTWKMKNDKEWFTSVLPMLKTK